MIAIDQDPAGRQGRLIKQDDSNEQQVWSKTLQAAGSRAVALFNRGTAPATISVQWTDIGLASAAATVQDLWAGSAAEAHTGGYSAEVPAHSVVLLKVSGNDSGQAMHGAPFARAK